MPWKITFQKGEKGRRKLKIADYPTILTRRDRMRLGGKTQETEKILRSYNKEFNRVKREGGPIDKLFEIVDSIPDERIRRQIYEGHDLLLQPPTQKGRRKVTPRKVLKGEARRMALNDAKELIGLYEKGIGNIKQKTVWEAIDKLSEEERGHLTSTFWHLVRRKPPEK